VEGIKGVMSVSVSGRVSGASVQDVIDSQVSQEEVCSRSQCSLVPSIMSRSSVCEYMPEIRYMMQILYMILSQSRYSSRSPSSGARHLIYLASFATTLQSDSISPV
jgi:hypothetical protein